MKREAVAHLQAVMGLSEWRACCIVEADRKMVRYQSCRPPETELRGRLRDLANERRRFGYRGLFILLRREGEPSGINRIYRLYREEGLTVCKRRSRRRAVGTRAPILVEAKANARWSLDFVHDQFACGRRFRVLNIVDDVTRECLAAIPDTSIWSSPPRPLISESTLGATIVSSPAVPIADQCWRGKWCGSKRRITLPSVRKCRPAASTSQTALIAGTSQPILSAARRKSLSVRLRGSPRPCHG